MRTQAKEDNGTLCTGRSFAVTFVGAIAEAVENNAAIAKGFKGISIKESLAETETKAEGEEATAIRLSDPKKTKLSYGSIRISTNNTAAGAIDGHEKASEANGAGHRVVKLGNKSISNSGHLYLAETTDLEGTEIASEG